MREHLAYVCLTFVPPFAPTMPTMSPDPTATQLSQTKQQACPGSLLEGEIMIPELISSDPVLPHARNGCLFPPRVLPNPQVTQSCKRFERSARRCEQPLRSPQRRRLWLCSQLPYPVRVLHSLTCGRAMQREWYSIIDVFARAHDSLPITWLPGLQHSRCKRRRRRRARYQDPASTAISRQRALRHRNP